MSEQQRQDYPSADGLQFCYMYIQNKPEAWTCCGMGIIGIALLIFSSVQFNENLKINKVNLVIKLTYISIILAIIFYLSKVLMAEIIFFDELSTQYVSQKVIEYLNLSRIQFILDCAGIFFMQTCIILVPANWFRNIISIFQKLYSKEIDLTSESNEGKYNMRFEKKSLKFLYSILVIRTVVLLASILLIALLSTQVGLIYVAISCLIQFQLESVILLVIIFFGLISVVRNKKLQQILDEKDYRLMKTHYILLLACSLLRLATDLSYTITFIQKNLSFRQRCFINESSSGSVRGVINIILEGLLTFYLSLFVILLIYKAKKVPNNLHRMLGPNQ